jgi:peroxin-3
LDRAIEVLFEGLEKNVFGQDAATADVAGRKDGAVGVEVERIRLAGLLPGLARWSQLALNGLPNELIDVRLLFPCSSFVRRALIIYCRKS